MNHNHQIFIRVENVNEINNKEFKSRKEQFRNRIDLFVRLKKEYEIQVKQLGENKHTILAYSHQCFHGKAPLVNTIRILEFNTNCNNISYNPFKPDKHRNVSQREQLGFIKGFMEIWRNDLPKRIRGGSIEHEEFDYLNEVNSYARHYYDRGDNNDGITIIDIPSNKYCFMFINKECLKNTVPNYEPLTAEQYARVYYPQSFSDLSKETLKHRLKNSTREKLKLEFKENRKESKGFIQPFKKFDILTKEEINSFFPKQKKLK